MATAQDQRPLKTYGAKGQAMAGALPGTPQAIQGDNGNMGQAIARANDTRASSVALPAQPGTLDPAVVDQARFAAWNELKGNVAGAGQAIAAGAQSVMDAAKPIAADLFKPGPGKLNIVGGNPGDEYNAQHEIRNFNTQVNTTPGVHASAYGGEAYTKQEPPEAANNPATPVVQNPAMAAHQSPAPEATQPPQQTIGLPPGFDPNVARLGNRTIAEGDTRLNETLTQAPNGSLRYDFQSPNGGTGQVSSNDVEGMRRVAGIAPSRGTVSVIASDQTAQTIEKEKAHQAGMAALRAGGSYDDGYNAVTQGTRTGILAPPSAPSQEQKIAEQAIANTNKTLAKVGTTQWDTLSRHDRAAMLAGAGLQGDVAKQAIAAGTKNQLSPEQRDYYQAGAEQRRAEAANKNATTQAGKAYQYQSRKVKQTDELGNVTETEIPGMFDPNTGAWKPLDGGDQQPAQPQKPATMSKADFDQYLKENPKISKDKAMEILKSKGLKLEG